ncbi:hypothetical protein INR77_02855 [Erythrobacter sp. SCSIO 43205]|uniref:hypothetical protein n=1 Tax=Erythrobacter sp. SCSIO 43205 TaxID=2779361 RepID=UPI001CA9F016|nr:hypothetical protein [Erythrobacter sp. SCSIO 43205]UAB78687.1 hypothetical protein INR77_02855 [Erythrobacter sp. SCSIO 43205]
MNRSLTNAPLAALIAAPLLLGLAACNTEPEVVEEAPVDESTIVDATAPGVGAGNPEGDAEPSTAVPGEDVYGDKQMEEPEPPSGAEATNDIEAG